MDMASAQQRLEEIGAGTSAENLTQWTKLAAVALAKAINTDTYDDLYAFFNPELVQRIMRIDKNRIYNMSTQELSEVSLDFLSSDIVAVHETMQAHCLIVLWTIKDGEPRVWIRERWVISLPKTKPGQRQCPNCGASISFSSPYCKYCHTYYPSEGDLLIIKSTST